MKADWKCERCGREDDSVCHIVLSMGSQLVAVGFACYDCQESWRRKAWRQWRRSRRLARDETS